MTLPREAFNNSKTRSIGFTLIELLTVIAIVGILAAVIIPAVGKVQNSENAAKCTSNLRSISNIYLLTTQNYGGQLIPATGSSGNTDRIEDVNWYVILEELASRTEGPTRRLKDFCCPTAFDLVSRVNAETNGEPIRTTFGSNAYIGKKGSKYMSNMISPAETLLLADVGIENSGNTNTGANKNTIKAYHNDMIHASFMDGHVSRLAPEDVPVQGINVTGSDASIFWRGL